MQTSLVDTMKNTPAGREADAILRSCVHCGFCIATCPTYQLLGDELDGPRGRIYLIKQVLEGGTVTEKTQMHLDRCLTCHSCETTCPSGVEYGRLLDIGREYVEQQVQRSLAQRFMRGALRKIIPHEARFTLLLRVGRWLSYVLPASLQRSIAPSAGNCRWPDTRHRRTMLVLEGCVQPGLVPTINAAAARVLDKLGITLLRANGAGCCGAVSHHLSASDEAMDFARRNIDAWWPHVEGGAEAIVMTASGCGLMVKDYEVLLRDDPVYAAKAARISGLAKDLGEILSAEDVNNMMRSVRSRASQQTIAFQSPCTLQHGLALSGVVERLLQAFGFSLTPVADAHLCCGAAGTYSILQRPLSQRLLENKLAALQRENPALIATANIGCLTHLKSKSAIPVRHWIELIDEAIGGER